jgi:uncharacterized damage-inducible protein DinB
MAIKEALLPEYEHEMATTRLLLERVPDADAAWKPHPRSMSLGGLAMHIVTLQTWVPSILEQRSFDVAPPDGSAFVPPVFESREQLLGLFDASVARAREAIAARTDGEFMMLWTLRNGGVDVFTSPRVGVLRTFLLNHVIHHRGQLTVYLRLRDVPLPNIYGPTADDAR